MIQFRSRSPPTSKPFIPKPSPPTVSWKFIFNFDSRSDEGSGTWYVHVCVCGAVVAVAKLLWWRLTTIYLRSKLNNADYSRLACLPHRRKPLLPTSRCLDHPFRYSVILPRVYDSLVLCVSFVICSIVVCCRPLCRMSPKPLHMYSTDQVMLYLFTTSWSIN